MIHQSLGWFTDIQTRSFSLVCCLHFRIHLLPCPILKLLISRTVATSVCPLYCRFCTRSYSVGANTDSVTKKSFKPILRRWEAMLEYIENTEAVTDVVVSGGDSFYLSPEQLRLIGERLLNIDHIKRFRFASKGLAVSPSRIIDPSDTWTDELIRLSNMGRRMGKAVALHTHFNHPNEITWVTRKAAQRLFQNGVTVRNQTVLLKGVNDDVSTMKTLIRALSDNNVQPVRQLPQF